SSWLPSQTSALPGKRFASASSQSSPPHETALCPSPSASAATLHCVSQRSAASLHVCVAAHEEEVAAKHPRASAPGAPGMQRSAPLQNNVSEHSPSLRHGVAASVD